MTTNNTDLDVSAPDEVSAVLRNAAQSYHESVTELSSAWQDEGTGKVWGRIARILENAALKIDKVVAE